MPESQKMKPDSIKSDSLLLVNHGPIPTNEKCCACPSGGKPGGLDPKLLEEKLAKRENELREEFADTLERETSYLKQKFDFILQNEQIRTAHMLRQAHRERKEKVSALQQQMECKNLAALMYVMCAERTRCKFQKLQIIEKYTNYIKMLNDILVEGQALILHLSRNYKQVARVNYEWQEKMKKVVAEFQGFVYHFSGGTPEQIQFFFDMPKLLSSKEMKTMDPDEDPIDEELEEFEEEDELEKTWWSQLDSKDRPFVVYGDMADFKPPQRRETLKHIKAAKSAPRRWREYAFHDMFMESNCPNAAHIKNEYFDHLPDPTKWECHANYNHNNSMSPDKGYAPDSHMASRRHTSIDMRGNNMGSILKIITAVGLNQPTKTNLLGARDSMEISSNTRVRDRSRSNETQEIKIGNRKNSLFNEVEIMSVTDEAGNSQTPEDHHVLKSEEEDPVSIGSEGLAKDHNDSLLMVTHHVPDQDHKIAIEKTCPMEKCHRLHMDAFLSKLPKYMNESPFIYVDQTYDKYEACTQEQLEILRERLEEGKKKDKEQKVEIDTMPTLEWQSVPMDVGVQTETESEMELPPCTCRGSSSASTGGNIYKMEDLIPVKIQIDRIKEECLFDDKIQFNRFKVIGQESENSINRIKAEAHDPYGKNFGSSRLREIKAILKQHPSLCELFQANQRC